MISALCVLLSAALTFTPAPRDTLAARMVLHEVSQHGIMRRSDTSSQPGQCRRFQVNSFAAVSGGFTLEYLPGVTLQLPSEHAPKEETGRSVGACWDMPPAEEGNAYTEAARFDYNRDLTRRENLAQALSFLQNARAGDVLQMLATYDSGSRGTHTVLITQPFDPRDPLLYWTDSNFANTLVDGVRYGYVRAWQSWPLADVARWLTTDFGNGATLYRLREDIVQK